MFRAALKSLLGRKLRLIMSTFAIVLGVAFVVGTLIFTDTLNRSFTALFASTVGDVVVRPAGGQNVDGQPSTSTIPARLLRDLRSLPGAARVDGNVNAFGAYVVDKENKVVGDSARRRSVATGPTLPRATTSRGCRSPPGTPRTAPTRSCSTRAPPTGRATSSASRSTS